MSRVVALAIAVMTFAGLGCSSSSSVNLCCYDINGVQLAWTCPTTAAFDACCNTGDPSTDGCLVNPDAGPQNTCTAVSYNQCT